MSPSAAITERAEFRNDAGHVIGVSTKRAKGEMKSMGLLPGDTVWLDEEEQIATANAPRDDADNPFTNGHLTLVTEPKEIVNRRQIGYSDHQQVSDLAEEPGPAAGGSEDGAPPGGSGEQGDDPPEAPPKAPEEKVPPPNLDGVQTPAQEAQAKAAANRAIKTQAAAPPKPVEPAKDPSKPPEGKRAPTEEVGTPEAEGK